MKKSELHFTVTLDEQKVPESITWQSSDEAGDQPNEHAAHAVNISIWNKQEAGTMRIGLWTKDMPAAQLKRFYVDTIGALGEDVARATDDTAMADRINELCHQLLQALNTEA